MKKRLTKLLFLSLPFSATIPTGARANILTKAFEVDPVLTTIQVMYTPLFLMWGFCFSCEKIQEAQDKYNTKLRERAIKDFLKAVKNNNTAKANLILEEQHSLQEWPTHNRIAAEFLDQVKNGHTKIVKLFLKHGAIIAQYNTGRSALVFAAKCGYTEIVKLLLKYGFSHGKSEALIFAAKNNHTEIVKLLLKYGANARHKNGQTALIFAVKNDHREIVKLLLKYGANANAQHKNGQTALMIAAENNHTEITKLLLEYGADANVRDNNGRTTLVLAAQRSEDAIQMGDIELKDEFNNLIKLLLVFGANPLIKDNNGKTVLDQNDNEIIRKFMHRQILPILNDEEFIPITENPA